MGTSKKDIEQAETKAEKSELAAAKEKDPDQMDSWRLKWSAEWEKITSKLLGRKKKRSMWEVEEKVVAGQLMYEIYKNIQKTDVIVRRVCGGLFLSREDAEEACRKMERLEVYEK